MQRLFVAIVLIAYGAFAQEKQTVKDTSAGAHYGVEQQPPSYGYQQPPYQQPPMYQPQPSYFQPVPTFPQYALPNYDVSYCSLQASFPLVGVDQDKEGYRRHGRHHRKFDRQSCRHTAIFSQEACDTCCKIASRTAAMSYSNEVMGALFVFDPEMDFSRRGHDDSNKGDKAVQCVCCAPKRI